MSQRDANPASAAKPRQLQSPLWWADPLTPGAYEVLVTKAASLIERMYQAEISTDEALAEWRRARMEARGLV